MVWNVLLVAAGGALGSVSRYLLSKCLSDSFLDSFPFGTFSVNMLGCLFIGLLAGLAAETLPSSMRLLLVTGFCGGFTTFSTFANESLALMRVGDVLVAGLYVGGSVVAGIFAVFVGQKIAVYVS